MEMKKYLSMAFLAMTLTLTLTTTGCDPDEALPNGTIVTTDSSSSTLVLKGYQSASAGFSVLQPSGFASPVYLLSQQFYGKSYSFIDAGSQRLDALTTLPATSENWAASADVKEGHAYWARYNGSAYRFIKLRVAYIDGNNVGIEYVVMSETQERPNSNANTGFAESASLELEMPRRDASHTFVAHYVTMTDAEVLNYSLEWNAALKHAQWVAFSFDETTCQDLVTRTDAWAVDPLLPKEMQVDNSYHTSDGFDRGHLCASEDRVYSTDANKQTFYFSNMSPQLNSLNSGFWAKLEARVQTWGRQSGVQYDHVYVAKGGTMNDLLTNFTGTVKGNDGVIPTTDANGFTIKGLACPKYYFMAVLAEKDGAYQAIAFLVEHKEGWSKTPTSEELQAAALSIDQLEQKTGIDFFCNLPDAEEEAVEMSYDVNLWSW